MKNFLVGPPCPRCSWAEAREQTVWCYLLSHVKIHIVQYSIWEQISSSSYSSASKIYDTRNWFKYKLCWPFSCCFTRGFSIWLIAVCLQDNGGSTGCCVHHSLHFLLHYIWYKL